MSENWGNPFGHVIMCNLYRGNAYARRRREREMEIDYDERDRLREKDELEELRLQVSPTGKNNYYSRS